MVALQIRNVPDDVRDTLVARAAAREQSLQAYLLELVKADAHRTSNAELLLQFEGRTDGIRSEPGEIAREIERMRAERDAHVARSGCPRRLCAGRFSGR